MTDAQPEGTPAIPRPEPVAPTLDVQAPTVPAAGIPTSPSPAAPAASAMGISAPPPAASRGRGWVIGGSIAGGVLALVLAFGGGFAVGTHVVVHRFGFGIAWQHGHGPEFRHEGRPGGGAHDGTGPQVPGYGPQGSAPGAGSAPGSDG